MVVTLLFDLLLWLRFCARYQQFGWLNWHDFLCRICALMLFSLNYCDIAQNDIHIAGFFSTSNVLATKLWRRFRLSRKSFCLTISSVYDEGLRRTMYDDNYDVDNLKFRVVQIRLPFGVEVLCKTAAVWLSHLTWFPVQHQCIDSLQLWYCLFLECIWSYWRSFNFSRELLLTDLGCKGLRWTMYDDTCDFVLWWYLGHLVELTLGLCVVQCRFLTLPETKKLRLHVLSYREWIKVEGVELPRSLGS